MRASRVMRLGLCTWLSLAAIFLPYGPAEATPIPSFGNQPVTILVGFGPGGLGDTMTRLLAQKMSQSLGVSFIIKNLPGASGLTAVAEAARAQPDGHTMLLISGQNAAAPSLYKSLPYKPDDLRPVSLAGAYNYAFVVPKDSKFKSLSSILAAARAAPGQVNIGTISSGSVQNLTSLYFTLASKTKFQVIPYRTTGELILGLMAGQVQMAVETVPGVIGQIQGGSLRALAVSSTVTAEGLKGVPSVAASGVANFNIDSWNGYSVPAKTPMAIVAGLNQALNQAIAAPDVRQRFAQLGITPIAGTPQDLQNKYNADFQRWRQVIEQTGIQKR